MSFAICDAKAAEYARRATRMGELFEVLPIKRLKKYRLITCINNKGFEECQLHNFAMHQAPKNLPRLS